MGEFMKYVYIIRFCYDYWILKDFNFILLIFIFEFCVNVFFLWRYVKDIFCVFLILRLVNILYNLSLDIVNEYGGFVLEIWYDDLCWCSVKLVFSEFCCLDIKVFKFVIIKLYGKFDFKKLSFFVLYFWLVMNGSSGCWRKLLIRKFFIDGWVSCSWWFLVRGFFLLKFLICIINLLIVGLLLVIGFFKFFFEEVGIWLIRNLRELDWKFFIFRGWVMCIVSFVLGFFRIVMDVIGKILVGIG